MATNNAIIGTLAMVITFILAFAVARINAPLAYWFFFMGTTAGVFSAVAIHSFLMVVAEIKEASDNKRAKEELKELGLD